MSDFKEKFGKAKTFVAAHKSELIFLSGAAVATVCILNSEKILALTESPVELEVVPDINIEKLEIVAEAV